MPKLTSISNYYQLLTEQWLQRFPKTPHFISVARIDRPIGIYLLLWPTLWALWLAADGIPSFHLLVVFVLGTALTRSAGCVINDVADRNFDGDVERTKARPLATGELEVTEALLFMGAMLFVALVLVLSTNLLTVGLSVIAALIAGAYPFMKRYTYLPQVVLGLAFAFGIPMAYSATQNAVPSVAWLILLASVLLTVAYDTAYAMVDREDDLKIGMKSTAILFGDLDKVMIGILQAGFVFCMFLLGRQLSLSWPYWVGLAVAAMLLIYQQWLIKDRIRANCFEAFLNNHWVGLAIFLGILMHFLIS